MWHTHIILCFSMLLNFFQDRLGSEVQLTHQGENPESPRYCGEGENPRHQLRTILPPLEVSGSMSQWLNSYITTIQQQIARSEGFLLAQSHRNIQMKLRWIDKYILSKNPKPSAFRTAAQLCAGFQPSLRCFMISTSFNAYLKEQRSAKSLQLTMYKTSRNQQSQVALVRYMRYMGTIKTNVKCIDLSSTPVRSETPWKKKTPSSNVAKSWSFTVPKILILCIAKVVHSIML